MATAKGPKKPTDAQLKGEHGTIETKKVGGVIVNAYDAEDDDADSAAAGKAGKKPDYDNMSKSEMQEALDKLGTSYPAGATKQDLRDLLPE